MLDPDEVASVVPDSEKTLSVSSFVGCGDVDDVYFDKPYYLSPTDPHAEEAYALIREGMRKKKMAALAQTVLCRRVRTVLIRASSSITSHLRHAGSLLPRHPRRPASRTPRRYTG